MRLFGEPVLGAPRMPFSARSPGATMSEAMMYELFCVVADIAKQCKAQPIKTVWEYTIDEHWKVAVSGPKAIHCSFNPTCLIPRFTFYFEFNGFPAGILNPASGGQIAAGSLANMEKLLEAAKKALERERAK
jgi:hypothetical protein